MAIHHFFCLYTRERCFLRQKQGVTAPMRGALVGDVEHDDHQNSLRFQHKQAFSRAMVGRVCAWVGRCVGDAGARMSGRSWVRTLRADRCEVLDRRPRIGGARRRSTSRGRIAGLTRGPRRGYNHSSCHESPPHRRARGASSCSGGWAWAAWARCGSRGRPASRWSPSRGCSLTSSTIREQPRCSSTRRASPRSSTTPTW